MDKELTPEEVLSYIIDVGVNTLKNFPAYSLTVKEALRAMEEYAQMEVEEKVNKFVEFCADNYSLEIPPRIVDDFKTTS